MAPSPLIGRAAALHDLVQAWAQAQQGHAQVRVVRGSAGSGKSALLQAVADATRGEPSHSGIADAPAGGPALHLRASGHVAEAGIPFAGLHQLLGPVADDIDGLGDPARAHLRRALTLDPGPAPDLLTVASAVLTLVGRLSRKRPVLIAVDDVHWLDRSTRQVLIFLARRLDADPVCLLLGLRTEHADLLDAVGTALDLGPMPAQEVAELLRARHPDLTSVPAARVAEAAGGLPLALVEIPSELTPAQRAGTVPLPDRLPIGERLGMLYERRIEALSEDELFALLLASFEPLDRHRLEAALTAAGLDLSRFDRAERNRLVQIRDGRCEFQHPTARAAIRQAAPIGQTRRAHQILAELWQDQPERATGHLVHVPQADPGLVAAQARDCAERAAATYAHGEAASWWEVVAEHAPAQATAARSEACRQYALAGAVPQATRLLELLLQAPGSDRDRADLSRLATAVSVWSQCQAPQNQRELATLGLDLAASDVSADRASGSALLTTLAMADLAAGEYRRAWTNCHALLHSAAEPELPLATRLLCDAVGCMVGAPGAGSRLRVTEVTGSRWEQILDPESPTGFIVVVLGWLDEREVLRALLAKADAVVDQQGLTVAAAHIRGWMNAQLAHAEGDWDRADRAFAGVERLLLDSDFAGPFPFLALRHAELHAGRGDAPRCHAVRRRAREGARAWPATMEHLDAYVQGLLAISERDFTAAAEALATAAAIERRSGAVVSGYTSRFPDEFEAHWHLGTAQTLIEELEQFERQMRAVQHRTMLGLAARCRALLCPPEEIDGQFATSADLLADGPPFERARTLLLWGQRLRRQRRKADARTQLGAAEQIFAGLGAAAWVTTCRSELAACGERRAAAARPETGPIAQLTPREFEVAREVAAGSSNAVAARRLFISERTVEFHLSRVYRKLQVDGREQLHELVG